MFRRLRAILCLLSLGLCLTTGWLWWRSYEWFTGIRYGNIAHRNGIFVDEGAFYLVSGRFLEFGGRRDDSEKWSVVNERQASPARYFEGDNGAAPQRWKPLRVLTPRPASRDERQIIIPHWFMMLLLALWPAFRFYRWIRWYGRHRVGCCQVCGYDLRATPERCLECETSVQRIKEPVE